MIEVDEVVIVLVYVAVVAVVVEELVDSEVSIMYM
jgi:hypothetical protein